MSSISTKFVSSFSELYITTTNTMAAATGSALETINSAAPSGYGLVTLVSELGSIANEANIIDVPAFGEIYKGKLRGQLDAGQLDTTLFWAPRNDVHVSLRNAAELGTVVYVTIKWKVSKDGTDAEYVTFKAFVSSFGIDTSFDDVAKANVTFAIDGALIFLEG